MGKRIKRGQVPEVQLLLLERQAASRTAWARRHPEIAGRERALRKQRVETLERWKHKNEGTPETHEQHSHRREGALARLYKNGTIDSEQLAAAAEIGAVAERIGRDVAVKTASLETRIDVGVRRTDALHDERIGAVRREVAYTRWRLVVAAPALVLDMLVEDVGIAAAAERHRVHARKARRLLLRALDLWSEILSDVFRQVDERDLDYAHARLAA